MTPMLTADGRNNLLHHISEKRKEISSLQAELNSLNEKKEHFFRKKIELSEQISALISNIKKNRDQRNSLTVQVRQTKQEREDRNKTVREHVDKIKALEKERDSLLKKHNMRDPTPLLHQVSALDHKIETEPMSFEKEKKIMQKINELKKQAKEAKIVSAVVDQIRTLSRLIDEKKRVAQESHRKVQHTAKKSQDMHESIIESSKEIETLKKQEEEAFKNFIDFKKKFVEVNDQLKAKLSELKEFNDKIEYDRKSKKVVAERNTQQILHEKKLSVEEKIRKKMKLTTEDILAFQGMQKN